VQAAELGGGEGKEGRAMKWKTALPAGLALLAGLLTAFSGCQKSGLAGADLPPTVPTRGGEMVLIPAGSFQMGSRHSGREDETPVHEVALDAFLMDKYEVTQQEFKRLELPDPSHFKGPTLPAEQVTWVQAALFCNARSKDEGLEPCYDEETAQCNFDRNGYRLPTEAEWEYACRAGATTDYSFGSDASKAGQYGWFADIAEKKTHPVGEKKPNAWGLYDMLGNVAEWCNDYYDKDYYKSSPSANPRGPADGKQKVLRGGAWNSAAAALTCSYRFSESPGFSDACLARDAIGFRCVRKAPDKPSLK
jgi:formylglycine-generating enzyme required for sulfatase activity